MKLKLLIALLAIINIVEAQKIYAHWDNGVAGFNIYKNSYKHLYSYKIGIGLEQKIIKRVDIGTEINFFKSGFSFQIHRSFIGYAQIPIFLKVKIFNWLNLFMGYSNKIFIFQYLYELNINKRTYMFELNSNKRFVFDYYFGPEFKIFKKLYLSAHYFNDFTPYYVYNEDMKKMYGGLFSLKYQIN